MSKKKKTGSNGQGNGETGRSLPALQFDSDGYLQYVQDHDLNEEQAIELLGAIWLVVVNFVDLGFGLHPVQQVHDVRNCETMLEADSDIMIICDDTLGTNMLSKTAHQNGQAAKERDS
jgi:hypothetical protein